MAIVIALCIWYFSLSNQPVRIIVQRGDSASKVGTMLKNNKLIYSKTLFMAVTRLTGSASKIKAGIYEFNQRQMLISILSELKNPANNTIRLTIPEGLTVKQIAEIVSAKLPIDKEKFIDIVNKNNLEGYLLPETYFLNYTFAEQDIINMMNREFEKAVTPQMREKAEEMGFSMKEIIILASIIEKEAVKPEERAIISSVFHNRLNKRIKLESCATVLYAMGIVKPRLTYEDIKFDSPYNTYLYYGLPPGPIANAGIESIKAALYPADTDKLFFVASGDGGHLFADGFKQHVENKKIANDAAKKKKNAKK
ncbi:MAG: endolytic transglycosylase MltG [Elusimicrobiota bacterium]|nr:endolytic transglycosylase MltG [Elusimicrobiota bacterium]